MEPTGEEEPVGSVELVLGAKVPSALIRLPARESGVAVARQFVAGVGSVLHVAGQVSEDIKLAATEACTNAVVHAYPNGSSGPVELEIDAPDGDLQLVVRDSGGGPPENLESHTGNEGGYGFELMGAVADLLRVEAAPGGGTEVRMTFREAGTSLGEAADVVHSPVLRRVVAMMAAHAGFTMDRLSDAVLVAETLAAHTPAHSVNGSVRVTVEDVSETVTLRVGPLVDGGAEGLLADSRLPAYGGVLEHLADKVSTEHEGGDHLVVRLARRR